MNDKEEQVSCVEDEYEKKEAMIRCGPVVSRKRLSVRGVKLQAIATGYDAHHRFVMKLGVFGISCVASMRGSPYFSESVLLEEGGRLETLLMWSVQTISSLWFRCQKKQFSPPIPHHTQLFQSYQSLSLHQQLSFFSFTQISILIMF